MCKVVISRVPYLQKLNSKMHLMNDSEQKNCSTLTHTRSIANDTQTTNEKSIFFVITENYAKKRITNG